jgi:predicted outer membrane repeat protein
VRYCVVIAVALVFCLAAMPRGAGARIWHVNADKTGEAPTIQAGIDSAASGDVILLAAGTYRGPGNFDVDFKGKAVAVESAAGAEATTIDCQGSGRGFVFVSGEDPRSILCGVRVANGSHTLFGGAVYCVKTSPTIENSIFAGNQARIRGGAICCDTSLAIIRNNVFEGNESAYGGAVSCFGSASLEITNNEFRSNSADISGGAVACRASSPSIQQSRFIDNTAGCDGGAIHCGQGSGAVISTNTFRDNAAEGNGGAIGLLQAVCWIDWNLFRGNQSTLGGAVYYDDFSGGLIEYNTFDENEASSGTGAGMFCTNYSAPSISNNIVVNSAVGNAIETKNNSAPAITCCCFHNNAGGDALPLGCIDGGGNFALDPEFCGIDGSGNYFLQSDSPCAPGNTPTTRQCSLIGAFAVNCATTSAERKTWGAVKALYGDE